MTTLQNWEIELYSAYIATSTAKNLKRSLRHKLIPIEGFFKFVLGIFLRDPLILIAFQIIKLSVTTLYFIRHPFLALYAVPANWRRIALQNNIMQPPEVLPGIDGPLGEKYDFGWWQISKISSYSWKIPEYNRGNMGGDFLVIVWAPAFLARLVFKSMAFFWSPLLWIAYPLHQTGDIAAAMARLCRLAIYKLQRWYSGIILGIGPQNHHASILDRDVTSNQRTDLGASECGFHCSRWRRAMAGGSDSKLLNNIWSLFCCGLLHARSGQHAAEYRGQEYIPSCTCLPQCAHALYIDLYDVHIYCGGSQLRLVENPYSTVSMGLSA